MVYLTARDLGRELGLTPAQMWRRVKLGEVVPTAKTRTGILLFDEDAALSYKRHYAALNEALGFKPPAKAS